MALAPPGASGLCALKQVSVPDDLPSRLRAKNGLRAANEQSFSPSLRSAATLNLFRNEYQMQNSVEDAFREKAVQHFRKLFFHDLVDV